MIDDSTRATASQTVPCARTTITGGQTPGPDGVRGRIASAARRWLWRSVLAVTGGLTVTGALPRGGCVVVANHSSHADTAALLAAIDSRHRPRFVAAADYWSGLRGKISRALGAAVPVRRTGGGSADLAGCAELLAAGQAVVVYPEGTRGDGEPGRFHAGAFRLAAAAGVPVVPVGIAGTAQLLPKHGRLHRRPVAVRIGTPMITDPDTPAMTAAGTPVAGCTAASAPSVSSGTPVAPACRAEVARLAAPSAPVADSRWRVRASRIARGRVGITAVAAWAFAEAVYWPLVPELILFALLLAAPRAGMKLIPAAVLASMAGGLCTLALGAGAPSAPLVTDRMRATVHIQTAAEGAEAVRHQPLSGIPFKVYAAEAGRAGVAPLPFLREATIHRGARIALVGAGCALAGAALRRARHLYPAVVVGGTALFAVGFSLVVATWS
jgi:1-acyl-sn-glycerol-3-phosphate acyltransferase